MSSRSADFNYKVALASGLKSLQGGRLRQAEEQFRYLQKHFPAADGGYRGLAKVLVEQEDRPAALRVLLDGGASLAKAGERTAAIALYREASALAPRDLTAHRRLAAALSLAGENDEAAHEYARYVQTLTDAGDGERAKLEAAYAMERLPGNTKLDDIARDAGATVPMRRHDAPLVDERIAAVPLPVHEEPEVKRPAPPPPSRVVAKEWSAQPPPSSEIWAPPPPARQPFDRPVAPDDPWAAEMPPAPLDLTNDDEQTVEATAAQFLAKRDPRGGQAALEAARRYIADGRMDAASDLLLQLIASGIANHEAQRLLVDVTKRLGKTEVARMKVKLLVQALRLDGHAELAAEVEQQAETS